MNFVARLRTWLASSQSSPSDRSSPSTQALTPIQTSARSVMEGLTFTVQLLDWDGGPASYYAIVNGEKTEVSEDAFGRIPESSWCRVVTPPSGKEEHRNDA